MCPKSLLCVSSKSQAVAAADNQILRCDPPSKAWTPSCLPIITWYAPKDVMWWLDLAINPCYSVRPIGQLLEQIDYRLMAILLGIHFPKLTMLSSCLMFARRRVIVPAPMHAWLPCHMYPTVRYSFSPLSRASWTAHQGTGLLTAMLTITRFLLPPVPAILAIRIFVFAA